MCSFEQNWGYSIGYVSLPRGYKFVLFMHTDLYLIIFISVYKSMPVSVECFDPSFRKVKVM